MSPGRRPGIIAAAWLLTACSANVVTPSVLQPSASSSVLAGSPVPSPTPGLTPTAGASPSSPAPGGVYGATVSGAIDPSLAGIPERVYVPDEISGDVVVIDPATFQIVRRFKVGRYPEHITPDWDLSRLYVNNMNSSSLTVIDPRTSRPSGTIRVLIPYDVYFTLDGAKAVVVNDLISPQNIKRNGLAFYDRHTWHLLKFVQVPFPGADDLDMSADGSYLMVSCEYSGRIVKVDTRSMRVVGSVAVGSLPRDVRLAPDGRVFFVANEGLNVVQVVDPIGLKVVMSIPTGAGPHGLEFSRDATRLYVNNRTAGTITVIDVATLRVITTWRIGGSPDEMVLSPDGGQLWISNRRNGGVSVVDTRNGKVLATIATGNAPHGLTYWPQPGTMSVGQNGNMR
ncbi:MAG: hypothetical protein M3P14_04795 [Chloroflexota bacterium]|nr:hypothetical protein [Chloroflexota bacterium]